MRTTDIVRFEWILETESFQYRCPMKFGGRVVSDVTVLNSSCDAILHGGARTRHDGPGRGAMTMGVAWAWPDPLVDDSQKLRILIHLAEETAARFQSMSPTGHPLVLCEMLGDVRCRVASELFQQEQLAAPIPKLAQLLATSPLESSLFDAQGRALEVSSYRLLGRDCVDCDLGHFLGSAYAGRYLDQYVTDRPTASLPLYHLVGALDPLAPEDAGPPLNDGYPEHLGAWIRRDQLTHLKIKLDGSDPSWDLHRILGVHRIAKEYGKSQQDWNYSLDFNERCKDAAYVLELIDALEQQSPEAFASIRYIEQPTHRDLEMHPENVMHEVSRRLPVVIDESLVDLRSLRTAQTQGYSGVALKACKGHSEALLMAAVAQQESMYLCVQDLTCVGRSLLHSASIAAHLPGVTAIESNGRQYCPQGNDAMRASYPGMFDVTGGQLPTACLNGPGLGYL